MTEVLEGELSRQKARHDQYGEVYLEDLFLISFSHVEHGSLSSRNMSPLRMRW